MSNAFVLKLKKILYRGRISFSLLEKYAFNCFLFGIFIPLSLNLVFLRLYIWTIPLLFLTLLVFTRRFKVYNTTLPDFDLWDWSIIGLILVLFVSTFMGENMVSNWPHFSLFAITICLGVYVRHVWGKKITIRTLVKLSFAILFIQSITAIVQQITFSQFGNPMSYFGDVQEDQLRDAFGVQLSRVQGTLGHPNLVANWIIVAFPFVFISTMIRSKLFGKKLWLLKRIAIALAIIAMIFTLSRGNILFFILMISAFSVIYLRYFSVKISFFRVRLRRWVFISLLMIVGLIAAFKNQEKVELLFYVVDQRISETFGASTNQSESTTASFRMEMNKGALQAFTKNPIMGYGFQNSQNIWADVNANIPWYWDHRPHNIYLVMAVEGGILTLLLFSLITLLPIYKLVFKYKKKEPVRFAFLFSLLACTGFSQVYLTTISPQLAPLYMILLGGAMGYLDQIENAKNKKFKLEIICNY